METISLKEAATIVGKDESTIRKFFSKPENKQYREIKRGKVYVSKDVLIKQYVGEYSPIADKSGTPRNSAETPGTRSELHTTDKQSIDTAMQALVSQLEAKDNQIADLLARLQESNINHSRALQQNNPRTDQEQVSTNAVAETLAALVTKKDEEIARLNTQLQESGKVKNNKVDYTMIAVILVLVAALVTVMLINQ
jgi:hypothetical protein